MKCSILIDYVVFLQKWQGRKFALYRGGGFSKIIHSNLLEVVNYIHPSLREFDY